jgi:hypothetical protein
MTPRARKRGDDASDGHDRDNGERQRAVLDKESGEFAQRGG